MGAVIGTAASVIGAAAGVASLFYPVTAVEQRDGTYKVCSEFDKNDLRAPYDVCPFEDSGRCIERCAFNVPEFELPAIQRFVESCDGEFKKISRRSYGYRGKRDVPTNGWTF